MTYSGIFLHEKAQPGTPLLDEDLFGKVVTCPEIAHAADWTLSLKQPNQTILFVCQTGLLFFGVFRYCYTST